MKQKKFTKLVLVLIGILTLLSLTLLFIDNNINNKILNNNITKHGIKISLHKDNGFLFNKKFNAEIVDSVKLYKFLQTKNNNKKIPFIETLKSKLNGTNLIIKSSIMKYGELKLDIHIDKLPTYIYNNIKNSKKLIEILNDVTNNEKLKAIIISDFNGNLINAEIKPLNIKDKCVDELCTEKITFIIDENNFSPTLSLFKNFEFSISNKEKKLNLITLKNLIINNNELKLKQFSLENNKVAFINLNLKNFEFHKNGVKGFFSIDKAFIDLGHSFNLNTTLFVSDFYLNNIDIKTIEKLFAIEKNMKSSEIKDFKKHPDFNKTITLKNKIFNNGMDISMKTSFDNFLFFSKTVQPISLYQSKLFINGKINKNKIDLFNDKKANPFSIIDLTIDFQTDKRGINTMIKNYPILNILKTKLKEDKNNYIFNYKLGRQTPQPKSIGKING